MNYSLFAIFFFPFALADTDSLLGVPFRDLVRPPIVEPARAVTGIDETEKEEISVHRLAVEIANLEMDNDIQPPLMQRESAIEWSKPRMISIRFPDNSYAHESLQFPNDSSTLGCYWLMGLAFSSFLLFGILILHVTWKKIQCCGGKRANRGPAYKNLNPKWIEMREI